jgi:hypothetical protein
MSNIEYALFGMWIGYYIGWFRATIDLRKTADKNKLDYNEGYKKGRQDEHDFENGVSIDPSEVDYRPLR